MIPSQKIFLIFKNFLLPLKLGCGCKVCCFLPIFIQMQLLIQCKCFCLNCYISFNMLEKLSKSKVRRILVKTRLNLLWCLIISTIHKNVAFSICTYYNKYKLTFLV